MDKVFLEKCTFFPQKTLSFDKKGLHNNMQPLFYLCFVSYFAGVCVPVAGNVGTFSASVD